MNRTKKVSAVRIGRSLIRGLRQALAYERGELEGRVEVYEVPDAVDVGKIREQTGLSQADFANRYGAYLMVIAHNPKAVDRDLFRKAS